MTARFKVVPFVFLHRLFGSCVFFKRTEMRLSQNDVGIAIGRSNSFIATIENGHDGIPMTDFLSLCNLFDFNPSDFFELE